MDGAEQLVPSSRNKPATVRRPRGQLAPPLPVDAPRWRRLVRGTYRLCHGLVLHDALLAAPAMAFHFFLSLLPLLVFVGYVVGLIARRRGVEKVLGPLLDNLPATTEALVRNQVERLAGGSALAVGPVAAITFLWIASGGAQGLMSAIENLVGAPRRAWWKKRLLATGWVFASLATFAVLALALVQWDAVVHPYERSASVTALPSASPISASRTPSHHVSNSPTHAQSEDRPESEPAPRRRARIIRSGGERGARAGRFGTFRHSRACGVLPNFVISFEESCSSGTTGRLRRGRSVARHILGVRRVRELARELRRVLRKLGGRRRIARVALAHQLRHPRRGGAELTARRSSRLTFQTGSCAAHRRR